MKKKRLELEAKLLDQLEVNNLRMKHVNHVNENK